MYSNSKILLVQVIFFFKKNNHVLNNILLVILLAIIWKTEDFREFVHLIEMVRIQSSLKTE